MPKLKTHRGVAKRFKVSGTGKILYRHAGKSHLLTKKARRIKHRMKEESVVGRADAWTIRRLLPYGS